MNFNNVAKKAAKKIYKTGLFNSIELERNLLSFKDCHGVNYQFRTIDSPYFGELVIFRVDTWSELAPTYESEYNQLGMVERSKAIFYHIQNTDNPDYILRACKSSLLYIH